MNAMHCVQAWVAAAVLMLPRAADACETITPPAGLSFALFDGQPVAEGGVLVLRGEAYGVDVEAALQTLLLWEVRRDDVVVPGAFEVVALHDSVATSVTGERHVFALVWRPDTPFTIDGAYTVAYQIARSFSVEEGSAVLDVRPAQSATLPEWYAQPHNVVVDGSDVVCCETLLGSCGDSSLCGPTRGTTLPAIRLNLELIFDDGAQQIVWVAQVLPDGTIGPRVQADADGVGPSYWYDTIVFDTAAEQYCVVIGVSTPVDGKELISEPQCVTAAQVGAPTSGRIELSASMESYEADSDRAGRCVGPLVYEADGAAYPREAQQVPQGCSVGSHGLGWWVLLALIRRRRARA